MVIFVGETFLPIMARFRFFPYIVRKISFLSGCEDFTVALQKKK